MTNNICEAGRLYRFFFVKRHLEIGGDLGGGDNDENDEDVHEDDEDNDDEDDDEDDDDDEDEDDDAGRRYVGGSVRGGKRGGLALEATSRCRI